VKFLRSDEVSPLVFALFESFVLTSVLSSLCLGISNDLFSNLVEIEELLSRSVQLWEKICT